MCNTAQLTQSFSCICLSEGVDPAVFANKLMQNCKDFVQKGVTDPIALMKMAYKTVLTLEVVRPMQLI